MSSISVASGGVRFYFAAAAAACRCWERTKSGMDDESRATREGHEGGGLPLIRSELQMGPCWIGAATRSRNESEPTSSCRGKNCEWEGEGLILMNQCGESNESTGLMPEESEMNTTERDYFLDECIVPPPQRNMCRREICGRGIWPLVTNRIQGR